MADTQTCQIEGCDREKRTRGWCGFHYQRWWKYGDPMRVPPTKPMSDRWEVLESGCWQWLGGLDNTGYGQWSTHEKSYRAHRRVYEELVGPIPEGLQLDHLCRNRSCVNPDHLEPVTQRENVLRGEGITARFARRTHCANGHELTEENIYYWKDDKTRHCRACQKVRHERQTAARRERASLLRTGETE